MAGRMTVCNMSIEAGARAGMIAPDHVTFEYLRGRQFAPAEGDFEAACALWRALHSDQGAKFDRIADIDAASIAPMVTWGHSPEAVTPVEGLVPDPEIGRASCRERVWRYGEIAVVAVSLKKQKDNIKD